MTNDVTKADIRSEMLEAEKLLADLPQTEMPPTHYHAKELYGREITIPAGTLLIGKIHKHSSLNVLIKGKMRLLTEDGVVELEAPLTVVSNAGTKRMAYAHTECVWLTVHGTQETELEKIEEDVVAPTFDDVVALGKDCKKLLGDDLCHG